MSGGSLDYLYGRVNDAVTQIDTYGETPVQRAFARHLEKVAKALHDLEWVMSGDYGEGGEVEAIMAVISPADVLQEATRRALEARDELNVAIENAAH